MLLEMILFLKNYNMENVRNIVIMYNKFNVMRCCVCRSIINFI